MEPMIDDVIDDIGDELPPLPSRPAPVVSGFELIREIGRGGMGIVYRARHRQLDRLVALKLLHGGVLAGANERDRFLREARTGAALQHPNIVQVFQVGEEAGGLYLAMELVEGGNLADRLATGALSPHDTAVLIETLARAVSHAHDHGVIHRDLKPANVLMQGVVNGGQRTEDRTKQTEDKRMSSQSSVVGLQSFGIPKIADFGLARMLSDETARTISGTILGTPSYMAPEQASGRGQVGPGADVYALGSIMYECLTGRPPFRTSSTMETLHLVETAEPVPPSRLQPTMPRDLSTICLTCLQKEPSRRYASAGALADDLRRYLDGRPIVARAVGVGERMWRWCRRNPKVAILLAALAMAIVSGFVGVFTQWRRAEHLYTVSDSRRREAEKNLQRYQDAAEDFADLIDFIDVDQLLNIRAASMRRELLVPALDRNQRFLAQFASDPKRRAQTVQAQIRVAILLRILGQSNNETSVKEAALEAGRKALAEVEALAIEFPNVPQYRRDRAALTQNVGFLLHSINRSEEALPLLQAANHMRQELLDAHPDHLDYRSELANTWNDIGLVHWQLKRGEQSLQALVRAAELQREVVRQAPQVPRYRRFLCNHHFNRAMTMAVLFQSADAVAVEAQCVELLPDDAEQYIRYARICGICHAFTHDDNIAQDAVRALRKALDLGFSGPTRFRDYDNLGSLSARADFQEVNAELDRRLAKADRQ